MSMFTIQNYNWQKLGDAIVPENLYPTEKRYDLKLIDSINVAVNGVAISGDGNTLLISNSRFVNTNMDTVGKVYIYEKIGGKFILSEEIENTFSIASNSDFGVDSAINHNGDTICIGAFQESDSDAASGAIYIFEKSNGVWNTTPVFSRVGTNSFDRLGSFVIISDDGNTVVSTAQFGGAPGGGPGEIYIFERQGGIWQLPLIIEGDFAADQFGNKITISGDGNIIAAGVASDDEVDQNAGKIKVYKKTGGSWNTTPVFILKGTENNERLTGVSFNFDGTVMAAGSSFLFVPFRDGFVRIFRTTDFSTWSEDQTISIEDEGLGEKVVLSSSGDILLTDSRFLTRPDRSSFVHKYNRGKYVLIKEIPNSLESETTSSGNTVVSIRTEQNTVDVFSIIRV